MLRTIQEAGRMMRANARNRRWADEVMRQDLSPEDYRQWRRKRRHFMGDPLLSHPDDLDEDAG